MITGSPFKEILKVIDRDVFWLREMTVADSEICSKTICSKKAQTAMDLGLEDGRRGDGPVVGVLTGLLAAAALQRHDALLAGGGGGGGGQRQRLLLLLLLLLGRRRDAQLAEAGGHGVGGQQLARPVLPVHGPLRQALQRLAFGQSNLQRRSNQNSRSNRRHGTRKTDDDDKRGLGPASRDRYMVPVINPVEPAPRT